MHLYNFGSSCFLDEFTGVVLSQAPDSFRIGSEYGSFAGYKEESSMRIGAETAGEFGLIYPDCDVS
jgi:hypothetical protein